MPCSHSARVTGPSTCRAAVSPPARWACPTWALTPWTTTFERFTKALAVPVLANITEFGQTPLFTLEQLRSVRVGMVLYPLSAFRAMNKAAEAVYTAIRRDGTQRAVLAAMQTREELYERIGYHAFEQKLDALYARRSRS